MDSMLPKRMKLFFNRRKEEHRKLQYHLGRRYTKKESQEIIKATRQMDEMWREMSLKRMEEEIEKDLKTFEEADREKKPKTEL